MDESGVSMMMGSAVLLIAAILVAGHYRREHWRAQRLRQLDHAYPLARTLALRVLRGKKEPDRRAEQQHESGQTRR